MRAEPADPRHRAADAAPRRDPGLPNPLDRERRIRAVLFDLDGTLYRQRPVRALMALELLTLPLSRPLRAPQLWRALSAYRAAQETLRSDTVGAAIGVAQLDAAATASRLPKGDVQALVDEWMFHRPLKYVRRWRAAGIEGLLDDLRRADVKAGILSDYPVDSKLQALGLAERFSPVLCATDVEVGAFKPHPRGFLRACRIWRLPPADVLMVGDRVDVDAAGAAAAGMPCVIVGGSPRRRSPAGYLRVASLERLRHALDDRR
jgi:HAD superfamily hydrolase (TIGR01549 family)